MWLLKCFQLSVKCNIVAGVIAQLRGSNMLGPATCSSMPNKRDKEWWKSGRDKVGTSAYLWCIDMSFRLHRERTRGGFESSILSLNSPGHSMVQWSEVSEVLSSWSPFQNLSGRTWYGNRHHCLRDSFDSCHKMLSSVLSFLDSKVDARWHLRAAKLFRLLPVNWWAQARSECCLPKTVSNDL
jgi:hypothetical protein